MKSIFQFLLIIVFCSSAIAQSPQKMNYQGVARDNAGNVLANQNIGLRLSVLSGSISGTVEYSETQATSTNDFGLFNIPIGDGTVVSGTFSSINWGNTTHFIQIEMDATGSTNYDLMGTSQLISVPYALYAEESGSIGLSGTNSQTLRHNGSNWESNSRLKNDGSKIEVTDNSGASFATFDGANKNLLIGTTTADTESGLRVDGTGSFDNGVYAVGEKTGLVGRGEAAGGSSGKGVDGYASGTSGTRFGGYFTGENNGGTSAYGIYGKGMGSSTTNFGVYGTATGGSTNWAGYFFQGNVYINNKLGIGDITPTYPISITTSALRSIDINQSDSEADESHGVHVTMSKTATDLRNVNGGTFEVQRNGGQGYVRGVQGLGSNYGTSSNIQYAVGVDGYGFQNINGTSLYGVYGVLGQAQGSSNNKYGGYFIGNVYGSQFLTPSDKKLKTNFAEYNGALDKIALLKPLIYNFNLETYPYFNLPEGQHVGFLAEDLRAQFPSLVKATSQPDIVVPESDAKALGATYTITESGLAKIADGLEFEAVNYTGLIPVLVAGIQEQQKMIENQQNQINRLSKLLEEK
jgi:hypothetical protein